MGRRNFTMLGDGPTRALFLLKALCLNTCLAFCLKRFFKLKALVGAFNKERAPSGTFFRHFETSRRFLDTSNHNCLTVITCTLPSPCDEAECWCDIICHEVQSVVALYNPALGCGHKCPVEGESCTELSPGHGDH